MHIVSSLVLLRACFLYRLPSRVFKPSIDNHGQIDSRVYISMMPAMYAGNGKAQDGSKAMSEPNALEKLFAKLKVLPCLCFHRGRDRLHSDMLHMVYDLQERAECRP